MALVNMGLINLGSYSDSDSVEHLDSDFDDASNDKTDRSNISLLPGSTWIQTY
jgi:hypothetical protein